MLLSEHACYSIITVIGDASGMGKQENIILERITSSRNIQLMVLKAKVKSLDECINRLSDKIERDGTRGYYSGNSDVLRYSQEIWKASQHLQTLMAIEDELKLKASQKRAKKKK